MLEQHFIDLHLAEGGHEIGVLGEIDALAPRIAAADMQADADTVGSESISSLRMSAAHSLCCGRFGPHRLVELNVVASGGDHLVELIFSTSA